MIHLDVLPQDWSVSFGSMQYDDWLQDCLYDYISQDQRNGILVQQINRIRPLSQKWAPVYDYELCSIS